jgi:hypothetical protein
VFVARVGAIAYRAQTVEGWDTKRGREIAV